ncbi:MAG: M14 family zinc carboxypeptidase [Gemmatimonadota bacterium]
MPTRNHGRAAALAAVIAAAAIYMPAGGHAQQQRRRQWTDACADFDERSGLLITANLEANHLVGSRLAVPARGEQRGSMNYPFELPEARAVDDFLMSHPNIAGVQSFHNSGGMIIRGPGAARQGTYPRADIHVYDELAETGERMLPYYDDLVIWQRLYTVHGGFTDWTNDGIGAVSFSNELWNGGQYYNSPLLREQQRDPESPIAGQLGRVFVDDFLEFGDNFNDWEPFDHPEYGEVELGGWNKFQGRIPPRFMAMELFHRNMAFTLHHADQMPLMTMGETTVEPVGGGLSRVRVEITNERLIPTITARAHENRVVRPDLLTVDGDVEIVTAGWVTDLYGDGPLERIDQRELDRILVRNGHPGRTTRTIEYLGRGSGAMTVTYDAVKGGTARTTVRVP